MTPIKISDVLTSLCIYLEAAGIGTYRPVGEFQPDETALSLKRLPANPDRAIAVNAYGSSDSITLPVAVISIQLRFRAPGVRTDVDDMADAVFPLLHGRHHFPMGDLKVSRAHRLNFASLGVDDNHREERVDNYELLFQRP